MNLILKLNARFQPKHRFELEDALQEILEKEQLGEITGGGTAQNPDGVYKNCDINYVIEQMEQAIEGIGRMYSYWEGKTYTALYFYGSSFIEMREKIEPFLASYPLCQKCRIEQIA